MIILHFSDSWTNDWSETVYNTLRKGSRCFRDCFVLLPAVFAFIGHCFPFQNLVHKKIGSIGGGKGVSVFGGAILAWNPYLGLIGLGIWLVIMFTFRYVSIASIISPFAISGLAFCNKLYIPQQTEWYQYASMHPSQGFPTIDQQNAWTNTFVFFIIFILAICITAKHHKNISRLMDKKEPKIFSNKVYNKTENEGSKKKKQKTK